ncbi:flagellar protein export ATPase FliI [Aneurinibacillus aneurinilyticus]|uniref:Flagellar protein export ATPase FliI n=1 Tax=Aneurinibacillus aneurinilyticus ATCC 12856 TaxID=649747 RepID=U1WKU5_ANEAE|nr:flagellar protein export ATPase FliI [Aneurinibacillus aneurinilyticus]ERI09209.1 flagellar protein export ATPase FliI [Aneurinibacillus aneurinilyticus ATCC 12856]MED0707434.1 flagellar protein export ATPase FliI [Aneurinibacillus aneurinilyticus]MED0724758.1 flagellar protein export ATPase FliI [Aneurinibacillus aneurinilyticus]MED0733208.1 flagellar protein export ATPase FliI [Aneurinibacillus aneurinilyticus]MED0742815.1 flagellar protein export ATPase FliI [Aneurinibacillus aneurinilyt
MLQFEKYLSALQQADPFRVNGKVSQVIGLTVEAMGPNVKIGEVCHIYPVASLIPVPAEVVGFKDNKVLLMPLGELGAIGPGCDVVATGKPLTVRVGMELLGQVLDGSGKLMNGGLLSNAMVEYPVDSQPPNPLSRPRIREPLSVGVRAIDGLLTVGKGQRIGIFAGSGVGKSTLLSMIARNTEADVNVIGLIGERGREVADFIERDLGEEGLKRSVVVVATSDQPALIRIKGALLTTAIAEYFRDQGLNVMMMMDSVTRFAMAQREVGLAIGEPPATRGYTPSVFALLPRLLERAGTSEAGSITAFYTVLVEGDDMNDPIADSVRGILDGHIVLSRKIAHTGQYPAIDILASVSRVMKEIVTPQHYMAANELKRLMAVYRDAEDLINIGAYKSGANRDIDQAIRYKDTIMRYTGQSVDERSNLEESIEALTATFTPN